MLRKLFLLSVLLLLNLNLISSQIDSSGGIYYNIRSAAMPGMKFIVTYQLSQSSSIIYGQIYNPWDSSIAYPRFEVINQTNSEFINSSVTSLNSNTFVFTWSYNTMISSTGWDSYLRVGRLSGSQIILESSFKGHGTVDRDQINSTTCGLSNGNYAFVWEAQDTYTYFRTKCKIFDTSRVERVGGDFINTSSTFTEYTIDCTSITDKLFISWKYLDGSGNYGIKYVYFDNNKISMANSNICPPPCAEVTSSPKLSKTPSGSFVIVSHYNNNIYAKFETVSTMFQVNSVTGTNTLPDVGIFKTFIIVFWENKASSTSKTSIYFRKIDINGPIDRDYSLRDEDGDGFASPMLDGKVDDNSYVIFKTISGQLKYRSLIPICKDKTITISNPYNFDISDGVDGINNGIVFIGLSSECNFTVNGIPVTINTFYLPKSLFSLQSKSQISSDSCLYSFISQDVWSSKSNSCSLNVTFCHPNCSTCEAAGGTNADNKCLSCISNFYLFGKNCSATCPDGFYGDITYLCKACTTGCKYCTSTQCNTCYDGYFYNPNEKKCNTSCPIGFFPNPLTKSCEACSTNCDVCADAYNCSSCASNYVLLLDTKTCSTSCPLGYFNQSATSCGKCINYCEICSNTSTCSTCTNNYLKRSDGICYSSCDSEYYPDNINRKCNQCITGCSQCIDGQTCVQCNRLNYLVSTTKICVEACPSGFISNSSRVCEKCFDTNCDKCMTKDTCTICILNYFLHVIDGKCYNPCPDGFYGDSNTKKCLACDISCSKCNSPNTCIECASGFKFDLANNSCKIDCPIAYYGNPITNKCDSCISNCIMCTDDITCNNCSRGYFYNTLTKKCDKCISNCDKCINNEICEVCSVGYYFFPNDGKCYNDCPNFYYKDISSQKCLSCYFNVAKCPGISLCESGFMVNETIGKCVKCNDNCKTCTYNNPCTNCIEGFYYYSIDKKCYDDCPIRMYENTNLGICSPCVPNCDVCSNGEGCQNCSLGFFFLPSDLKCYNPCPDSYFENSVSLKCQSCIENCEKCSSSVSCDRCLSNYYLIESEGKCFASCPSEYFADPTTRKCERCSSNCERCSEAKKCSECLKGYYLFENNFRCYELCPLYYYGDPVTKKCQKCKDNCKKCSDSISCNECDPEYLLLKSEKKCYKSCPNNYYEDSTTYSIRTCEICPENCDICVNKKECIKCSANKYLNPLDKNCYSTCPADSITNEATMTCEPICSGGYYDQKSQKCESCSNFCEECLDYDRCTKCKGNGPCQNEGKCYINQEDYTFKCQCLPQYVGEKCEEKLPLNQALSQIDVSTELSNDQINLIVNINPQDITNIDEATKLVSEVAKNQMELMSRGEIPVNQEILKVSNTAFELKLSKMNSFNSTEPIDTESLQKDINNMKNSISSFTEVLISNSDLSNSTTITNNLFSLQYSTTSESNKQKLEENAYENNISLIDFGECETILKEKYKIPSDKSLIIKKIDFSSKMNLTNLNSTKSNNSDSILVEFLDPITKVKLDSDLCKDANTTVKAANPKLKNLNVTIYKKLAESSLDILNPESPAFKSRCVVVKDPKTGMDTTINYRIGNYYQNSQASCSSNCEYKGLNDKGYVICNCKGISKEEKQANSMDEFLLSKIPKFNVEIFECYYVGFKYPDLLHNSGFYVGLLITFAALVMAYFTRKYSFLLLKNSFKDVIFNDCKFFDEEEMTKEEYFNFNIKKPPKDPNTIKKIQACIEDLKVNPIKTKQKNKVELPIKNIKDKPADVGVPKTEILSDSKEIENDKTSSDLSSRVIIYNKVDVNVKKYIIFKNKSEKKKGKVRQIIAEDAVFEDIKNYRLNRRNIYERYPGHAPTLRDYESLSPYDAVLCDRRTFSQLFWSILIEEHVILSLFKKTILEPLWIRIFFFFFNLTLMFAINALFFTDDYIEQRADNPDQSSGFFYTLINEFPKTLFSLIITNIILFIVGLIKEKPEKFEKELNAAMKTRRVDLTRKELRMMPTYRNFLLVIFIINILCWYYVIVFCGVYISSSQGWIYGAVIGLIMDWFCFSVAIPILRTGIRLIVRKYKKMRFLICFEYIIWIRNFIS